MYFYKYITFANFKLHNNFMLNLGLEKELMLSQSPRMRLSIISYVQVSSHSAKNERDLIQIPVSNSWRRRNRYRDIWEHGRRSRFTELDGRLVLYIFQVFEVPWIGFRFSNGTWDNWMFSFYGLLILNYASLSLRLYIILRIQALEKNSNVRRQGFKFQIRNVSICM